MSIKQLVIVAVVAFVAIWASNKVTFLKNLVG